MNPSLPIKMGNPTVSVVVRTPRSPGFPTDPPAGPESSRAGSPSVDDVRRPTFARRQRRSRSLEKWTQPRAVLAVVGLSVALLGLSRYVGRDAGQNPSQARMRSTSGALSGGPAIGLSELEALRVDTEKAKSRLVADRRELGLVLEQIEGEARKRGWKVDVTLAPTIPAPDGVTDLVAFPAVLSLSPSSPDAPPPFGELLDWLDGISRIPQHVEVRGLVIRGNGSRQAAVQVDLQVQGRREHDEAPPK